jgi:histone demethylase JARID1
VHRVDRLTSAIGQFLSFASQPSNQRKGYLPQVRHYTRKLFKIQFTVSPSLILVVVLGV